RNADRRSVAVMAVAQRLDRGLDDEVGRAEIGLADAEIDDVTALRGERIGARQHGKGVLLADAIESGNGLQHAITSSRRIANSEYLARAIRWLLTPRYSLLATRYSLL